jgi:UDP-N-acetylmuramoyl-L-alanyl-D-glutamate--2,6-diaminopimelate ligase
MKLTQLFQDIETLSTVSLPDVEIKNVTSDTRKLIPNSLFVAQRGLHIDGHDLATQAIADGAVAIVAERELPGLAVPVILVTSTRMVYGPLWSSC